MSFDKKIIGKIIFTGELECLTGLHIGASKEGLEIGALDSPVVRDPLTLEPYIPGSSLKGKLRALLEKANPRLVPNRNGGSGISRHECNDWDKGENRNRNYNRSMSYPGALQCPVCRLFGSTSGPGEGARNFPSRLKVRDLEFINGDVLKEIDTGLLYTEWKFENSIDRVTSCANPRNLERVPKGAKFRLSIIYDAEDTETLNDDMENLKLAIQLLHDDALGGHGSRGYGQVRLDMTGIEARKIDYYRGEQGQAKQISEIGQIAELAEFFGAGEQAGSSEETEAPEEPQKTETDTSEDQAKSSEESETSDENTGNLGSSEPSGSED
ncbi:MAG: type III-A CRISPR-associated RAMP protein Csm3 [Desulfobacteraceae bacterium]|nr:type III-A CRISPR-associated RAMP protein Csm3 [Desulfobacteraceae bacterium]